MQVAFSTSSRLVCLCCFLEVVGIRYEMCLVRGRMRLVWLLESNWALVSPPLALHHELLDDLDR